jgi:hypothetical protein
MPTTVHRATLRFRQWAGGIARFRRKGAIVWFCILAILGFFALNWVYQTFRKPSEIFAPVGDSLSKTPEATWRSYGSLFEKYSTSALSPEFLAALAQLEGSGNPLARTYWRWRWSWNPLEIYRPASSAAGMFQITDGTFAEARKYCIHDHKVVSDGPWHDLHSCWFNRLYTRTLASHATEMTAAYLHQTVENTLAAHRVVKVSAGQKEKLAAVIHLCGSKRGDAYVRQRFQLSARESCGAHGLRGYLNQIDAMKLRFIRLKNAATS